MSTLADMAEKASAVPPYVPYRSFRNFLESLRQGIPARIDRSVMATMSGALQSQLSAALRFLKLIKITGQPNELLSRVVNSEGAERATVMQTMLGLSYPFLFQGFDLKNATPRMVEEKFVEAGASGGTVNKCMLFFLAAAKEAGVELSPHLKHTRGQRAQRSRPRNGRVPVIPISDEDLEMGSTERDEISWKQMLLSKFPSFDPAWSEEVQAKWFDAFDKLMKQGEEK